MGTPTDQRKTYVVSYLYLHE